MERVGETVPAGGCRHELRDTCGSLRADSQRIEAALLPYHPGKELYGQSVLGRRLFRARQISSAVGTCSDRPRSSLAVDWSGIAGVAPACAFAGAFAKASAKPSSGPAIRSIGVSFVSPRSTTRRAADWCRRLVQIVAKQFARTFGGGSWSAFCQERTPYGCTCHVHRRR